MSREFGRYTMGGYMHGHVRAAADDCAEEGRYAITRAFGKLLEALVSSADEVSALEAYDSGPDTAWPDLRDGLGAIDAALEAYRAALEGEPEEEPEEEPEAD